MCVRVCVCMHMCVCKCVRVYACVWWRVCVCARVFCIENLFCIFTGLFSRQTASIRVSLMGLFFAYSQIFLHIHTSVIFSEVSFAFCDSQYYFPCALIPFCAISKVSCVGLRCIFIGLFYRSLFIFMGLFCTSLCTYSLNS